MNKQPTIEEALVYIRKLQTSYAKQIAERKGDIPFQMGCMAAQMALFDVDFFLRGEEAPKKGMDSGESN